MRTYFPLIFLLFSPYLYTGDWGSARAVALTGAKSMTHGVGTIYILCICCTYMYDVLYIAVYP